MSDSEGELQMVEEAAGVDEADSPEAGRMPQAQQGEGTICIRLVGLSPLATAFRILRNALQGKGEACGITIYNRCTIVKSQGSQNACGGVLHDLSHEAFTGITVEHMDVSNTCWTAFRIPGEVTGGLPPGSRSDPFHCPVLDLQGLAMGAAVLEISEDRTKLKLWIDSGEANAGQMRGYNLVDDDFATRLASTPKLLEMVAPHQIRVQASTLTGKARGFPKADKIGLRLCQDHCRFAMYLEYTGGEDSYGRIIDGYSVAGTPQQSDGVTTYDLCRTTTRKRTHSAAETDASPDQAAEAVLRRAAALAEARSAELATASSEHCLRWCTESADVDVCNNQYLSTFLATLRELHKVATGDLELDIFDTCYRMIVPGKEMTVIQLGTEAID